MGKSKSMKTNKTTFDSLFSLYIESGSQRFENIALNDARNRMRYNLEVDKELLIMSIDILEIARKEEKKLNVRSEEWRNLAITLRRLAHKIYREYGDSREDEDFLRIVK